jgi:hypothetical protein
VDGLCSSCNSAEKVKEKKKVRRHKMKQVMLIVAILLMACVPAKADLAVWGLSADNADTLLETRLGWEADRIESGLGLKWFTRDPEWGPAKHRTTRWKSFCTA